MSNLLYHNNFSSAGSLLIIMGMALGFVMPVQAACMEMMKAQDCHESAEADKHCHPDEPAGPAGDCDMEKAACDDECTTCQFKPAKAAIQTGLDEAKTSHQSLALPVYSEIPESAPRAELHADRAPPVKPVSQKPLFLLNQAFLN